MSREPDRPRGTNADRDEDWSDDEQLVLGDLLNLVLDKGVVISGHVTISIADIDLIALDLRVLITSIHTAYERAGVASAAPAGLNRADVPLLPTEPGNRR